MRKWIGIGCILIGIIVGLVTVFSPVWDNMTKQAVLASYDQKMVETSDESLKETLQAARDYNKSLYAMQTVGGDLAADTGFPDYEEALDLSGDGMMGYVIIPKISVNLPIYHGTSDEVLAGGVGHMEDTSLPVGGENTRSILTGHRGLPTAKLFTRLDELDKGDLFFIRNGREENTLAYKVEEIRIIDPDDDTEIDDLKRIREGDDMVELMTCHPYGINTQRLFVIGRRVPYESNLIDQEKKHTSIMPSMTELAFVTLPFALISGLLAYWLIKTYKQSAGPYDEGR